MPLTRRDCRVRWAAGMYTCVQDARVLEDVVAFREPLLHRHVTQFGVSLAELCSPWLAQRAVAQSCPYLRNPTPLSQAAGAVRGVTAECGGCLAIVGRAALLRRVQGRTRRPPTRPPPQAGLSRARPCGT
jgi:hypothetical protein